MESVQTNSPVAARAFEYAQEAKRKREEDQQVAAKSENIAKEQHANQVAFSQAAQTRLSEEKTHDARLVHEVRVVDKLAASEAHSQVISLEKQKAAETRSENQKIRQDKDSAARANSAKLAKANAENDKQVEATAQTMQNARALAFDKASAEHAKAEKDLVVRTDAAYIARTIDKRNKDANALVEKENRASTANNFEKRNQDNKAAVDNVMKEKANTQRVRRETDKAIKMYQSMGKLA
ncbi:MAG: hypothetical protein WC073_15105 [Sterolibacterium sp.]